MRFQWFVTFGAAATLALSACSGSPAAPTVAPAAPTSAPAAATTAPQPTAAPSAVATTAPTVAPTTAPTIVATAVPTTAAASPTAPATPTVAAQPTIEAAATPGAAANTPVASGPDVQDAEIAKVADAWSKVKSFRVKTEVEKGTEFVGEFVAPDRSHVTISAGGQKIEFIEIGKDSYTKMGSTWTKSTASDASTDNAMTFDPKQVVAEFNDSKKDGQKLTKGAIETANGVKCQDWVITDTDGTTSILCIGLDDWLPHRAKSGEDNSADFYDFNAPIKIEAPI